MAVKDIKQYYYNMQAQYLEMKADIADFEQALQDGFITEDQLETVKEEINMVKNNYDRLSYIMYLLEMPNRAAKKARHNKQNQKLLNYFSDNNADEASVQLENASALTNLRKELKRLKESRQ